MRIHLKLAVIGCLLCSPALAGPSCYSPTELQAEQLLRLHSELMVITVTCRTGSQGEDLVAAYTGFTHANISELHEAEQTLIRHYGAGAGGTEQLDKLRTKLANEYGQKIANVSAPVFCAQYRDKVWQYHTIDTEDLHAEVDRMTISERSYGHPCNTPSTQMAKKGQ